MTSLALIVLDLQGTLFSDGDALGRAFVESLAAEGVQVSADAVGRVRGGEKRAALRMLAAEALGPGPEADAVAARAYERFEAALLAAYRTLPLRPFDGVPEALERLRAMGIALATNTGFPTAIGCLALERLGFAPGTFAAHVWGDETPAGRPAPHMIHLAMQRTGVAEVTRVLVCGDTPLDLRAGVNAGVAGVAGVLTGVYDAVALGRVRHTHLLPSVAALPALVDTEFVG